MSGGGKATGGENIKRRVRSTITNEMNSSRINTEKIPMNLAIRIL